MIARLGFAMALGLAACRAPEPQRVAPVANSATAPDPVAPDAGPAPPRFVEIAPGASDFCALVEGGDVVCENACTRHRRRELGGARHVAYAGGVACAIVGAGEVTCWLPLATEPEPVAGVTDAVRVSVGKSEACALLADASARCWTIAPAREASDAIGFTREPADPGVGDLVELDLGIDTACFVRRSGEVWCRGPGSTVPAQVAGIGGAARVAVGPKSACAAKSSGDVWCWNLGSGAVHYLGRQGSEIGAGLFRTCALGDTGRVQCWDHFGGAPTPVPLLPATSLAVGWMTSCVLRADGSARCWGGFCDQCGAALEICAGSER